MIISAIIFGLCAITMLGIGAWQMRSEEPVGFYTGQTPPAKEELRDVKAWNRGHGRMFILYGLIIMAGWFAGFMMGDSALTLIPVLAAFLVPIPLMISGHKTLEKKYLIENKNPES